MALGLRDIADKFDVAVSTVSRALGGDDGVGKARAASIRAAAEQMGYRPRPIRRKRTRAIGLVISTSHLSGADPNERYFQQLCWWMERLGMQRGLLLHLHFVDRDDPSPVVPAIVRENRVDGIVLAGHPSPALCSRLKADGIPAVSLSDTVERSGLDSVMSDETEAIDDLVGRLVSMGHRHVSWISTDRRFPVVAAGEKAFRESCRRAGLEAYAHGVLTGFSPDLAGGKRAVRTLLGCEQRPTAIIFTNDWMAFGGMVQLQRQCPGLDIPDAMSIIGQGNDSICEESDPRLTTIDRRVGEKLEAALEMLAERIESGRAEPLEKAIPARLVWRDSVGAAPSGRLAAGAS